MPQLNIRFDCGVEFFSITIINSIHENDMENQTSKKISKQDRNHGYGLYKIQSICEKYNGIFNQTKQQKQIITSVYLPL